MCTTVQFYKIVYVIFFFAFFFILVFFFREKYTCVFAVDSFWDIAGQRLRFLTCEHKTYNRLVKKYFILMAYCRCMRFPSGIFRENTQIYSRKLFSCSKNPKSMRLIVIIITTILRTAPDAISRR